MSQKLTDRELEVLTWASYGKTSDETSEILNISKNTVNFHIKNLLNKLKAVNKVAAVAQAMDTGILARHRPNAPTTSGPPR